MDEKYMLVVGVLLVVTCVVVSFLVFRKNTPKSKNKDGNHNNSSLLPNSNSSTIPPRTYTGTNIHTQNLVDLHNRIFIQSPATTCHEYTQHLQDWFSTTTQNDAEDFVDYLRFLLPSNPDANNTLEYVPEWTSYWDATTSTLFGPKSPILTNLECTCVSEQCTYAYSPDTTTTTEHEQFFLQHMERKYANREVTCLSLFQDIDLFTQVAEVSGTSQTMPTLLQKTNPQLVNKITALDPTITCDGLSDSTLLSQLKATKCYQYVGDAEDVHQALQNVFDSWRYSSENPDGDELPPEWDASAFELVGRKIYGPWTVELERLLHTYAPDKFELCPETSTSST